MDDAFFPEGLSQPDADHQTTVERIDAGAMFTVRLFRPTATDIAEATAAIGFELGQLPHQLAGDGPYSLRIAPGEWLLFDVQNATALSHKLSHVLHHVSNTTSSREIWIVRGNRSDELLQRGCSIDLDFNVFPAGRGIRTLLAEVDVVILRTSASKRFDIIADHSHASHLQAWFSTIMSGQA